jgi:hypothetical protein
LLVDHELKLAGSPYHARSDIARFLGDRDEEKADKSGHRNQRRSKRNPKAASAIGRDK